MTGETITGQETDKNGCGLVDLKILSLDLIFGINLENCDASGSEPKKLDLWRHIPDHTKVLETYYLEGNYYHQENLQELATLAKITPKSVRDTLARFRRRDEKAGKYVPPPPKLLNEFTEEQRQVLLEAFEECEYIDSPGAQEIARITKLTTRQITNWFCNQRRKVDGKNGDFDRVKRGIIKKERQAKGLMRASPFSPEVLKCLEKEYEKMVQLTEIQGEPAAIPYDMLEEKTGMKRKKIRDWFSKRKIRGRRQSIIKEKVEKTETNAKPKQILPSLMGRLSSHKIQSSENN
ncbi:hypothetical protein CAEBREN_13690 [Caenorhabditis brenneri]|uniref:Homeobox domain-containing protein n=1 Tax=Caenorhabditis brenneri TaxID=135651 RepID=G0MQM1_CAEBE|nr:hypothetical protein CAEBREN_13690 [Caenorhabditis brenneri]